MTTHMDFKRTVFFILLTLTAIPLMQKGLLAQSPCRVIQYDEEDGVPSNHITQLLQDERGFMWFATWNGLCRFDGYEFHTFKSQPGDGCNMPTDRIRGISLRPDGMIVCRADEDDFFLFDTRACRFSRVGTEDKEQAASDLIRYRQSKALKDSLPKHYVSFEYCDRQGNRWVLDNGRINLCITEEQHAQRLPIAPSAEVKCLFRDSEGRYWLTTREDAAVRIYDAQMNLLGFLGSDGTIHVAYTSFGAPIYCIYQTSDGTIWLGSKPYGLFRLHEVASGRFTVERLTAMSGQDVYDIREDCYGRLWVATMHNGLFYTRESKAVEPTFHIPKHYPADSGQRVRYIHFAWLDGDSKSPQPEDESRDAKDGVLMAATTDGLVTARLTADADDMVFTHHRREYDRGGSLSSSAIMDILDDGNGGLFISTESGGVNIVSGHDLLNEHPVFRHLNTANHLLPSDMALSMAATADGRILVVGGHLLSVVSGGETHRIYDAHFFHEDYRFSEARPLQLPDGRWLLGLSDGACMASLDVVDSLAYVPPVVLTAITIGGDSSLWAVEYGDTLTLHPGERNITVHFAALDYQAPERIIYAFRLTADGRHDSVAWNVIDHSRTATLLDMKPGTYRLDIRSTNADGQWQPNRRTLTIIVEPAFWEAWYGQLLMVGCLLMAVAVIIYTLLYIRRIKRKQHETLEAYLALLHDIRQDRNLPPPGSDLPAPASAQPVADSDRPEAVDPMLKRVMQFVEENIANSDANIGDMAAAAAVSRSVLQRKLKQEMGVTPLELLNEARMKRAGQLLLLPEKTVSEVAYACGFTDPKYFSRCFKQSTGKSPTEFKGVHSS